MKTKAAKIRRLLYVLATLLCASAATAATENYLFRHIGVKDGLSQTTVFTLLQDQTGFIWMGTKAGLNRYDGTAMHAYSHHAGQAGLPSDFISTLYEAPDGNLWVGTDEGVAIYAPLTDAFQPFQLTTTDGLGVTNNVTVIRGDGHLVYIASNEQGLFCYDADRQTLVNYPLSGHPNIAGLTIDAGGRLWIGFFGGGLYYSTDHLRSLHPLLDSQGREPFRGDIVSAIVEYQPDRFMVGTDRHGLSTLDIAQGTVTPIVTTEGGNPVFVRDIAINEQQVWAATEQGLYVYDMPTQQLAHFAHEPSNPFSLADNSLYALCRDRDGGMWLGSYFAGAAYLPRQLSAFERFMSQAGQGSALHGRHVREMVQDAHGQVWIGTEDGGLNIFNPSTRTFDFLAASSDFPNVHGLCIDGDRLWVGTFSYGLKVIDINTRRIVGSYAVGDGHGLRDNTVFSIHRSPQGDLWLGTIRGLCRYNRQTDTFDYDEQLPAVLIDDILTDPQGRLWVATQTNGVFRQTSQGQWHNYSHRQQPDIASDRVIDMTLDAEGGVWVATEGGGIYRYDATRDRLQSVSLPLQPAVNTVFQMVEDHSQTLWMSTYNSIISYHIPTGETRRHVPSDGINDNIFNYSSSLLDQDGRIYLGTLDGFIRFSPSVWSQPAEKHPLIVASRLSVGGQDVDATTPGSPLTQSITSTRRLRLSHRQNSIALQLSALAYDLPQEGLMEYRLENYDHQWQPMRADNVVAYSNLPAGNYRLHVRLKQTPATADDDYTLDIRVLPHPLLSWWAQLVYGLLAAVLIYLLVRFFTLRNRYQRQAALERFEHEKEQELYESKISFFTNVAHEIRTPLTLIKGPLENIIKSGGIDDKAVSDDLHVMQQNTNRLHDLINQLLDFRKTEANGLRLNFERCDAAQIVSSIFERFRPTLRQRHIDASIDLPREPLYAHADREGFTKIVSNLLNNATKYGESRVSVSLTTVDDQLLLSVANDGNIIPPAMREQIFTPFFRISSGEQSSTTGTGIGLAMARALTELHGGTISMDDSLTENVFCLRIPLNQKDSVVLDTPSSLLPSATPHPGAPTVLIVDDNDQMLSYEQQRLESDYNVVCASNGEQALARLRQTDVDVIVSDVMMEPVGGMELCRRVKHDVELSHIPLILLTALTTEQAKMEGMESGADAYIEKPFSMDYLLSTIDNLLHERQSVKRAYSESPFTAPESVSISEADNEFLHRLESIIERELTNSELSVDMLASGMNMSRSSLNRKIRGTLNVSPNDFIRIERLKRAAVLLKQGQTRVADVCYQVGFSTPSYFTKCFYRQFGLLPKDFYSMNNEQ
ncbi:MAG: response regulator [Prevotella sp.]|nr:response regulator [Prevotella sp.]